MRILMVSGSVRKGSFNSKLLRLLAKSVEKAGTIASLSELSMPFYEGDLEELNGLPEGWSRIRNGLERCWLEKPRQIGEVIDVLDRLGERRQP